MSLLSMLTLRLCSLKLSGLSLGSTIANWGSEMMVSLKNLELDELECYSSSYYSMYDRLMLGTACLETYGCSYNDLGLTCASYFSLGSSLSI